MAELAEALGIHRARRRIIYDNFLDTNSSESCNDKSHEVEEAERAGREGGREEKIFGAERNTGRNVTEGFA